MAYRWLALAVIGLHFGYLAYLVAGGFLAWRWPRTLALHLIAVTWGVLIIGTKVPCPLIWLQNALRTRGGQRELGTSFVDAYVRGVFYPADHEVTARALVAVVIAVSWLGLIPRGTLAGGRGHVGRARTADVTELAGQGGPASQHEHVGHERAPRRQADADPRPGRQAGGGHERFDHP